MAPRRLSSVRRAAVERPLVITAAATVWWALTALVITANDIAQGRSGSTALLTAVVAVAGWIPLSVGVFALAIRAPLRAPSWRRGLVVHLLASVGVVTIRAAYIFALDPWMHFYDHPPVFFLVWMHSVENNFFVYWLFVGVAHVAVLARDAVERRQQVAELGAALARAELDVLTATMQPHFLFNTLQAIAELVHIDVERADRAIVQLSGLLRHLVDERAPVIPLEAEIAFVRSYVAIEQLRFGDRLTVTWDIAPEVSSSKVPRLSLQPLVENALRHGLWPTPGPAGLTIRGYPGAHRGVVLEVIDTGERAVADVIAGSGLTSLRARIGRTCGPGSAVDIVARTGGGTVARMTLAGPPA